MGLKFGDSIEEKKRRLKKKNREKGHGPRAGLDVDFSVFSNSVSDQIIKFDDLINQLFCKKNLEKVFFFFFD